MTTDIAFKPDLNSYVEEDNPKLCKTCEILIRPDMEHCKQCGVCCELLDHHCEVFGVCICSKNLKYFILFFLYYGTIKILGR